VDTIHSRFEVLPCHAGIKPQQVSSLVDNLILY
jgi:hypothetical protein